MKIGDTVKHTKDYYGDPIKPDFSDNQGFLEYHKEYVIEKIIEGTKPYLIKLEGYEQPVSMSRFELVNEKLTNMKQIKYVESSENSKPWITKGKRYELLGEINDCYNIIDDQGKHTTHYKTRFKEVEEEREIEGYIAPEDFYGGIIKKGEIFIKAGDSYAVKGYGNYMLPKEIVEKWVPKYKELYKDGDYIVAVGSTSPDKVRKIEKPEIRSTELYWRESHEPWDHSYTFSKIRRATTQEIKDFEDIKLGGYKGVFTPSAVTFGCKIFSKSTVEELDKNGVIIVVEGHTISPEEIKKVLNRFP